MHALCKNCYMLEEDCYTLVHNNLYPRGSTSHEGLMCKTLEAYVWAHKSWKPQSYVLWGLHAVPVGQLLPRRDAHTNTNMQTYKQVEKYTESHFQTWKLKSWEPLLPSNPCFLLKASSHVCKTPQRAEKVGGLAKVTPTEGEAEADNSQLACQLWKGDLGYVGMGEN